MIYYFICFLLLPLFQISLENPGLIKYELIHVILPYQNKASFHGGEIICRSLPLDDIMYSAVFTKIILYTTTLIQIITLVVPFILVTKTRLYITTIYKYSYHKIEWT